MTQPLLGKTVQYHGSCESAHGLCTITHVPYDPDGRGYSLHKNGEARNDPEAYLHNVHRDSFTLAPEDRYEVAKYSPFCDDWSVWDHANKDWSESLMGNPYRTKLKEDAEAQCKRANKKSDW